MERLCSVGWSHNHVIFSKDRKVNSWIGAQTCLSSAAVVPSYSRRHLLNFKNRKSKIKLKIHDSKIPNTLIADFSSIADFKLLSIMADLLPKKKKVQKHGINNAVEVHDHLIFLDCMTRWASYLLYRINLDRPVPSCHATNGSKKGFRRCGWLISEPLIKLYQIFRSFLNQHTISNELLILQNCFPISR